MASVSKAEYLKRYLSKDEVSKDDKKKKRKKIKPSKDLNIKIIDDDYDLKRLKSEQGEGLDDLDDAPVVAEVIDERPKHVQELEQFRKNTKWKLLAEDSNDGQFEDKQKLNSVNVNQLGVNSSSKKHSTKDSVDSDSSPMRLKSARRRHDSDSDPSPVRRSRAGKDSNSHQLPPTKVRHDSNSDQSVPRKSRKTLDTDHSVPSRGRSHHDSDSDQSLPRKGKVRHDSDSDQSLPRKGKVRHGSSSDYSYSKKGKNSHIASIADQSPTKNKRTRHDSDSDKPVPRKSNKRQDSDSDESPLRKPTFREKVTGKDDVLSKRHSRRSPDLDQSHPRKHRTQKDITPSLAKRQESSDSDQSLHRKKTSRDMSPKRRSAGDLSPPRKSSHQDTRKGTSDSSEPQKKAKKTLGGAKAGLSSAKEMLEEAKRLKEKEDNAFRNIDEKLLGRNAQTVIRDRETGKRKNTKEEEMKKQEEEKRKEQLKEKYEVWGKGLKQQQSRNQMLEDQVHEASKPLARYKDDQDLNNMFKDEERDEDPMLNFIRAKRKKEEEKMGKKLKKELPKYKGPQPPPNRFNIMPGYRWDGVDRSNGFEKKIFSYVANRKAIESIAYKWSTEDM